MCFSIISITQCQIRCHTYQNFLGQRRLVGQLGLLLSTIETLSSCPAPPPHKPPGWGPPVGLFPAFFSSSESSAKHFYTTIKICLLEANLRGRQLLVEHWGRQKLLPLMESPVSPPARDRETREPAARAQREMPLTSLQRGHCQGHSPTMASEKGNKNLGLKTRGNQVWNWLVAQSQGVRRTKVISLEWEVHTHPGLFRADSLWRLFGLPEWTWRVFFLEKDMESLLLWEPQSHSTPNRD